MELDSASIQNGHLRPEYLPLYPIHTPAAYTEDPRATALHGIRGDPPGGLETDQCVYELAASILSATHVADSGFPLTVFATHHPDFIKSIVRRLVCFVFATHRALFSQFLRVSAGLSPGA
ncbi:hypothetical protein DFH09DRAFT_1336984 [Mycena vulgaris]|nr:hypothetical protein DFH09DRAFT_1336984 [Mycena vulgaris]